MVEVVDDSDSTGSYLIFTYADENRAPEVFDAWVETRADVAACFAECNWTIRWLDADPPKP